MTRETKIGLVVACSFLCLVGIVVASKINGGSDPSAEPQEPPKGVPNQVAAVEKSRPKPVAPTAPPAQRNPRGADATPLTVPVPSSANSPKAVGPAPPALNVPTPESEAEIHAKLLQQKSLAQAQQGTTADVTPRPPALDPEPKPVQLAQVSPPLPAPSVEPTPKSPSFIPQPLPAPSAGTLPGLPTPPAGSLPGLPAQPTKSVELPVPLPIPTNSNPPFSLPAPKDAGNTPSLPLNPQPLSEPKPAVPLLVPPQTASPVPALPFNAQPLPEVKPAVPQLTPPSGGLPAPPPSIAQTPPPGPNPIIPSGQLPSTPPIAMTPIIGTSPQPTSGLPAVRSTQPDVITARPGETTFAQLSQRLYGTDKYAAALQAFNKKYADGLVNGNALAGNQPAIAPGQQVWHPSVSILERDFGKQIAATSAVPRVPSLAPAPLGPVAPVVGTAPPPRPTAVIPAGVPVTTTPAGARVYRVQAPQGEYIRDIAQRVLGDPDRWAEIYQKNLTIQPQFAIPAGTTLTLP